MDDKDFVFINKNVSEKEDREFSDFLKKRKQRAKKIKTVKKSSPVFERSNALESG